jgi:hypothetical protein
MRRLLSRLVVVATLSGAPLAMAACPPDICEFGFELNIGTSALLGGDIYANWRTQLGLVGDAPVTLGAGLTAPFTISDSIGFEPPQASLNVQVTPSLMGFPVTLSLALIYDLNRIRPSASVGPFIFWQADGRSWSASITLWDTHFGEGPPPPVGDPIRFDLADLSITQQAMAPVPEPSSLALAAAGALVLLLMPVGRALRTHPGQAARPQG